MDKIIIELMKALGEDVVLTGEAVSQRATSYWDQSPTTALALLKPRTTVEVSQVLAICHQHEQPVVTHGGLTGCVEGAVARPEEIIISLERMNRIEDIDAQAGTATVEGLSGSISAEHGIGTEKLAWLAASRSEEEIAAMRLLKRSLDPKNLLNPGRVLA